MPEGARMVRPTRNSQPFASPEFENRMHNNEEQR
ncbi:hypothetical protein ABIB56_001695 [Glaciihabitans sp. UYNi722]